MRNRFPGPCRVCEETVKPDDGYVEGKPGAFKLIHHDCLPVAVPIDERFALLLLVLG